MKTIDTFLTNCKQGVVSSSKLSNAINEYSQKRIKFNQKKYDYFIKGQRQKEVRMIYCILMKINILLNLKTKILIVQK